MDMPRDKRWRVMASVPGVTVHKLLVESFELRADAVRLRDQLQEQSDQDRSKLRAFRAVFEVEERQKT